MLKVSKDIWHGRGFFAAARPAVGHFLIDFSAIYIGAMSLRYILTMIYRPEMRWFGGAIPICFHFVLAAFLFLWGRFINRRGLIARSEPAC